MFLIVPFIGNAQRLLEDNFEYSTGDLIGQGGWVQNGTASSFPLQVQATPQLNYENYQSEGIGKSVYLDNSGQDAFKSFTTQSEGDVYASVLVNFSNVQSKNTQGEYFFHFGESTLSTYYGGRVLVKQNEDGTKMVFGISKVSTSSATTWTTEEYELNKTHLIVLKYSFISGGENDVASLFVNPVISTTEPQAMVTCPDIAKTDMVDIGAIGIRQGTGSRTALGHVGALRVSTTWEGLFDDSGTTPDPDPLPSITTTPSSYLFIQDNLFVGESYSYTINVKAANLKEDIQVSIAGESEGEVTTEHNTIPKADAEAGFDFAFTVKPQTAKPYQSGYEEIIFTTEGVKPVTIMVVWSSSAMTQATSIAELKNAIKGMDEYELQDARFKLTGEVVVIHAYIDNSNKTNIFVEDATGGLKLTDQYNSLTTIYTIGDKLSNLALSAQVSFGSVTAFPEADFGTPLSQGNEVVPAKLTLADLKTQGARYEGCLVKVENVTITPSAEGDFGDEGTTPIYLKQTETDNSTLYVLPNADFIGKPIPETAKSIIGVSTSAAGTAIAPRSLTDIETDDVTVGTTPEKDNNICILVKNGTIQVIGENVQRIEVYTFTGLKVISVSQTDKISLPTGAYLVKITTLNGTPTVQKVLVK